MVWRWVETSGIEVWLWEQVESWGRNHDKPHVQPQKWGSHSATACPQAVGPESQCAYSTPSLHKGLPIFPLPMNDPWTHCQGEEYYTCRVNVCMEAGAVNGHYLHIKHSLPSMAINSPSFHRHSLCMCSTLLLGNVATDHSSGAGAWGALCAARVWSRHIDLQGRRLWTGHSRAAAPPRFRCARGWTRGRRGKHSPAPGEHRPTGHDYLPLAGPDVSVSPALPSDIRLAGAASGNHRTWHVHCFIFSVFFFWYT